MSTDILTTYLARLQNVKCTDGLVDLINDCNKSFIYKKN